MKEGIVAIGDGVSAIASLAVTFGGFSPTAMDGVEASKRQIENLEVLRAKRKAADAKRRELELARTSKVKSFADSNSIVWHYVIVDDKLVRIVGCDTEAKFLAIPEVIEGLPVYAIGPDACARLDSVEELVCPDSVEVIGSCAFRFCPNLKKATLSQNVSTFSSSWLQGCVNLEELVLPGMMETITLAVFDNTSLRSLKIGAHVHEIEPGAFQNTHLETCTIDPKNPYLFIEDAAIYSIDGKTLLALAKPVESCSVLDGCTNIAKKACYGVEELKQVKLPDTIRELGEFAFSHSGIEEFESPSSLVSIGQKVFYYCKSLAAVTLNDGIRSIGDSAFEESGIASLRIPASIEEIGLSITERTGVVHSGEHCSLTIDGTSKNLFFDGEGGLYRRDDAGARLMQLVDRELEDYGVLPGTSVIEQGAFAHQAFIKRVTVPDGVTRIESNAFRYCTALERVSLSDSVEFIGDAAFLDTELKSFRVPKALEHLGSNALVTRGAHRGEELPSLRSVEVAPGNERFYVESGMLCRRGDAGDSVVVFTNSCPHVQMPESVTRIEGYAFNNAQGIEYLGLNKGLQIIETAGLTTWCWIEHIHVDLEEPLEGRLSYDFMFPNTPKSKHGISLGIGGATWVNVPGIMAQYDICLINAHDYHYPKNPDNITIYDQVLKILGRLHDPVLLTPVNRDMFERLLRNHIIEISVDIARHDDREAIDDLVELGYITSDNLEEIIVAVGKLQDAAMTGYLLELKRRQFGRSAFDFDL